MARRMRRSGDWNACMCGTACSLVQLAENGSERQDEDLVAAVVGDMHDPVAPIFPVGGHDVGAGKALGVLAGLDQVADGGAALVDEHVFLVGAVEEDVGHVPNPFAERISQGKNTSAKSGGESGRLRGIR